ncbi:MAG: AMP-binding protein [Anaerolineales bacterium]|jgi:long-chain acyl-CoA synthetase
MDQNTTYLDKPWLKSYKLGPYNLPESLSPYPEVPVFKALDDAAAKYPNQNAVLYLGRSLRYRQLKDQVDRFAAGLAKMGVEKGDRVCAFLPNSMEFVISDWAIQKAGAAIVPTSILRTDEGLLHEAGSSNSRVIICQENNLERVLGVKDRCDLEHVVVTSQEGYDIQPISYSLPKGAHEFRAIIEDNDPSPPHVEIHPREDLCELAFTGGATGKPKGVMVTHFNRYSCLNQGFPWTLKPLMSGFVGKASVLVAIPMFHAYGHYTQQTAAILGLRLIILPDPRDTQMMVEHIEEYRPLFIPAVPTQLMRISEAKLSRMNTLLVSGAAPLPLEIGQAIKRKTGMPVSQGYGLTETSPLTHFNVSAFAKITGFMTKEKYGIGIPLPDTECRLIDPENGQEVSFGEAGELVVRGPQIMKGYWPERGSGLSEDGWLHTGDIAVMDEDGYFQIVDRTKDMVNVSGMKVYTTKVDDVLYKHPGVLMAAAFGVPDPDTPGSERVMAVIQLKDDYRDKVTVEEIRDFVRGHLAPYAVPKFVEFRVDLPLTVTEKVFKKVLREEAIERMRQAGKS